MPLTSQLVDIPFSGGLETKQDPLLVQAPSLLELQNCVFAEGGTLTKRNGFQPLGVSALGGGTVVDGRALATFKNELLQVTSTGAVHSYSDSQDSWVSRGQCSPLVIDDTAVIRNTYTQSNPDCDSTGSVTVFAWEDTRGGVRACAIDEATGAMLLPDTSISATGESPRVVAVGSTLCIVYAETATPALAMVTLDALAPSAFSTAYSLDASMPAGGTRIDAKAYDGFSLVCAWNYGGQTRIAIVLPAGFTGSPVNGYPSPVNVAIASTAAVDVTYDSANGYFWLLGASSTAGLYGAVVSTAFVAVLAATQVDSSTSVVNVTAKVSGTTQTAFYEVTAAADYNHFLKYNTLTSAGVAGSATVGIRSVGLASKLFINGTRTYLAANFSSSLQPTAFLLDVTVSSGSSFTWTIVGKGQPNLSGGLHAGNVPKAFSAASGTWSIAAPTRVQIANSATTAAGVTNYTTYFLVGVDRLDFTFADPNTFNNAEAGGNLLLAGGVLTMYDGQSVVEHGFHLFPESFSAVASASGGSMADGTYGITAVWYWTDAQGQLHRSAPGVQISVVVSGGGGSGSIALTIPTLRLTSKMGTRTAPIAAVFRTPVNGTLFQRVGNGSADPVTAPVYSTTTSDTVAFSLTVADATIAANEILYTTGGTLRNASPGACSRIVSSGARVFLAGIVGQPQTVAYSQEIVPGVPVEFAAALYSTTDPAGHEITGLGVIDEKAIIFKQASIFAMAGEGPDSTGNSNSFTGVHLVTGDVGTVVPQSIAPTPGGIIFHTAKGKYLLDRSLSVSYVGAPVEDYNSLASTSGITVDGTNQVRFTASDGVMLVYDYFFRQWGTFATSYGSEPSMPAYDAISWARTADGPDTYVYLTTGGIVMYETPGAYLDTSSPVAISLRTAWIKLQNLQGFVKLPWVTVLGRFLSAHTIRVGVAYDYSDVSSEYHSYNAASGATTYGTGAYGTETPYGGAGSPVYQFRFRPDTMKCQAIQFSFSEQSPSDGEGFALSGMTLQAAVANVPTKKLPAGQTVASS